MFSVHLYSKYITILNGFFVKNLTFRAGFYLVRATGFSALHFNLSFLISFTTLKLVLLDGLSL